MIALAKAVYIAFVKASNFWIALWYVENFLKHFVEQFQDLLAKNEPIIRNLSLFWVLFEVINE